MEPILYRSHGSVRPWRHRAQRGRRRWTGTTWFIEVTSLTASGVSIIRSCSGTGGEIPRYTVPPADQEQMPASRISGGLGMERTSSTCATRRRDFADPPPIFTSTGSTRSSSSSDPQHAEAQTGTNPAYARARMAAVRARERGDLAAAREMRSSSAACPASIPAIRATGGSATQVRRRHPPRVHRAKAEAEQIKQCLAQFLQTTSSWN